MPFVSIPKQRHYAYGFPQYWGIDRGKPHLIGTGAFSICGHIGNYLYVSALGEPPENACQNCLRMHPEPALGTWTEEELQRQMNLPKYQG